MQKAFTLKQIVMCSGNLSKAIEKAFLPELFYRSGIRSQDLYFQIRAQPISRCVSISLFWQYKWKNIQCHITPTACSGPNSKQWLESEDKDTYDSTHISIFWILPQYFPRKHFMRHHMQVLALFSTLSTRAMSALVTTWLGDTEPLRGRIVEPLHRPFDFCSQSRTQSPKIQQLWYQGSLCVNRPTMQIWFKDIFVMKLAWYFSSRSKFFDVGVSGRWEISSNSHGTFSVFKKRRKSFYQHFDHQFIQNHTTSFYFNTSQLLSIFF